MQISLGVFSKKNPNTQKSPTKPPKTQIKQINPPLKKKIQQKKNQKTK